MPEQQGDGTAPPERRAAAPTTASADGSAASRPHTDDPTGPTGESGDAAAAGNARADHAPLVTPDDPRPGALRRSTLADSLLTRLREQILAGRPGVGEPLPTEREIGEAFGVGRTTVREALRGLEVAGFVVRRAKRLVVQDPRLVPEGEIDFGALAARASIQEVFATRKLLEVEGARQAATTRSSADLGRMRAIVDEMATAEDLQSYQMHSMQFHTQVMLASGNRVLAQTYIASRHLLFKSSAFWKVFSAPGQRPIGQGLGGHREILAAIESGDAGEAARATFQHLSATEDALIRRVRTAESMADPASAPSEV